MQQIHNKLEAGARLLDLIERRRAETGDANLGTSIERAIVDGCLAELDERASNHPAPGQRGDAD